MLVRVCRPLAAPELGAVPLVAAGGRVWKRGEPRPGIAGLRAGRGPNWALSAARRRR